MDPEGTDHHAVASQRACHPPHPTPVNARIANQQQRHDDPDHGGGCPGAERMAEHGQRPHVGEARCATGNVDGRDKAHRDRHAVGQRRQRQVMPLELKRELGQNVADQRAQQHGTRNRQQHRHAQAHAQQRRAVGPKAHERRMPERDLPRRHQKAQADHHDGMNPQNGHQAHVVGGGCQQQHNHQRAHRAEDKPLRIHPARGRRLDALSVHRVHHHGRRCATKEWGSPGRTPRRRGMRC